MTRNGRAGWPARPFVVNGCSDRESFWSVSPGPDGERVSVVGEDRPSGPDLLAFVAFEAASAHPVAAFEVADPPLGAGSVALHPSLGAFGAGLLAARDEHPLRRKVFERLGGRPDVERTVECYLARGDPEPLELGDRVGQERVLARVPDRGRRRDDQSARATLGVLGHLAELVDVPELVRLAEPPLPDSPRVPIPNRHQTVLDRLARHALLDLGGDLLAPVR